MLQSLNKNVPQELNRIQFWGARDQELKEYPVIILEVGIKTWRLLEMVDQRIVQNKKISWL
jgi:hypothetical protein